MKKVAMIIAKNEFRDEEYKEPREIFEEDGIVVSVFSSSLSQSRGKYGLIVKPDKLLDELKSDDFDALVFVGGAGSAEYFDNNLAHEIVKDFYKNDKIVSAICIAPKTLAKAGLLKRVEFTSFPSVKDDIVALGGIYKNKGAVKSGRIITAAGPEYATEFGNKIVEALSD